MNTIIVVIFFSFVNEEGKTPNQKLLRFLTKRQFKHALGYCEHFLTEGVTDQLNQYYTDFDYVDYASCTVVVK